MSEPEEKKIVIAGVTYPVKPLVGRQLRFVMPALMRWRKVTGDISQMTPESYDDLYAIVYHGAIVMTDKTMTPTKMLDVPGINFQDLIAAVGTITEASGLFTKAKEGDTPMGEATEAGKAQTGT